jgi:hypothetical protein
LDFRFKGVRDLRKKEIELSALEKRIAEQERADREQGEKTKVLLTQSSKSAALHDDESATENRKQMSNLKERIAKVCPGYRCQGLAGNNGFCRPGR